MPEPHDVDGWVDTVRTRYENYLKTSFYFRDQALRESFQKALSEEAELFKGPIPEAARRFQQGIGARDLAEECFPRRSAELGPALHGEFPLYSHQERAIRGVHLDGRNIVVATGTGSGKTEAFLYPILFHLYRQYLTGELFEPGVRALILYPMNALANDQRERLGKLCAALREAGSGFKPTFGQYIGQTPEHSRDNWRNAETREEDRLPNELVFRTEMRADPPHILLTNYSMLEYLLIRPADSALFDGDRGARWRFLVLDEAHQYRGAKGMEMAMLVRRLKQRVREGGRRGAFRCIATSATISSDQNDEAREAVAEFAGELFGESFSLPGVIFGESEETAAEKPRRYHGFLRALEGAFLLNTDGKDKVVLNRKINGDGEKAAQPLEIALCRECGQHYYVGRVIGGKLAEAVRDPSLPSFGVEYYMPSEEGSQRLCRRCGRLSAGTTGCECDAAIVVRKCESHKERPDQLRQCGACGYRRGGIGDPVQEIVHGSDGPNAVIATALHELLAEDRRRVLAFADSRQEAAFFAWYLEDSYKKLRDRNLILRALKSEPFCASGLSLNDLSSRMYKQWEASELFKRSDTRESRRRAVMAAALREALTDERRLSLAGVGLAEWFVAIPDTLDLPKTGSKPPWNFTDSEAARLVGYLLDQMRVRRAMNLPPGAGMPNWSELSPWPQQAYSNAPPRRRSNLSQWGGPQSAIVKHFLHRLLLKAEVPSDQRGSVSAELMKDLWTMLRRHDRACRSRADQILARGTANGTFRLNPRWLRIRPVNPDHIWQCRTCATTTNHNIRGICPRNKCPGDLGPVDPADLAAHHYRVLYESKSLPPALRSEEHTAQISSDTARQRQQEFKRGDIHLLSSSTTFEVGVDLGPLETVLLRNVPPEPFNYTQRVGRAGRRDIPGLALTYCRRNPHDLYHYQDPESRVIQGKVRPPRLRMTNQKIITRHMVATALSTFFRVPANGARFDRVENLVGDWSDPTAVSDLKQFCRDSRPLLDSLKRIVPKNMHEPLGLTDDAWIDLIAGPSSHFSYVETEVCNDHRRMDSLRSELYEQGKPTDRILGRLRAIAQERTLLFLSRKAVIPKYGFPVDVVELDTGHRRDVSLQRDLSQAIAEYAADTKVVANKLEWKSYGIKIVTGLDLPAYHYAYDDARNFRQWPENDPARQGNRKYLSPVFGFVTQLFKQPREPHGRARRLYTTRPFFKGFGDDLDPDTKELLGIEVTKALPGTLVILCEGRDRRGFWICLACGAHMTDRRGKHKSPSNRACLGMLRNFSLGHELVTDVVRLQFPELVQEEVSYSVAYAVLLGASETIGVPAVDLNVTITGGKRPGEAAIVLYDNVPGGAGLVAELEEEPVLGETLRQARQRVEGGCGCDASCYGCLRSYRNQFAHTFLDRKAAKEVLEAYGSNR